MAAQETDTSPSKGSGRELLVAPAVAAGPGAGRPLLAEPQCLLPLRGACSSQAWTWGIAAKGPGSLGLRTQKAFYILIEGIDGHCHSFPPTASVSPVCPVWPRLAPSKGQVNWGFVFMVLTVQGWGGRDDKETAQDMALPEGRMKMQLAGSFILLVDSCEHLLWAGPREEAGHTSRRCRVPCRRVPPRWVSVRGCRPRGSIVSVLGARSPRSRCKQGWFFLRAVRRNLSHAGDLLAISDFPWLVETSP